MLGNVRDDAAVASAPDRVDRLRRLVHRARAPRPRARRAASSSATRRRPRPCSPAAASTSATSRIEVAVGRHARCRRRSRRAVDGCDAAVHAAAAIGITSGGAVSVHEQNVAGTAHVVGGAVAAGLRPGGPRVDDRRVRAAATRRSITTDCAAWPRRRNEYGRSEGRRPSGRVRRLAGRGAPDRHRLPGRRARPRPTHARRRRSRASPAPARRAGPSRPAASPRRRPRPRRRSSPPPSRPAQGPRRLLAGGHFLHVGRRSATSPTRIIGVRARRVPLRPKPVLLRRRHRRSTSSARSGRSPTRSPATPPRSWSRWSRPTTGRRWPRSASRSAPRGGDRRTTPSAGWRQRRPHSPGPVVKPT